MPRRRTTPPASATGHPSSPSPPRAILADADMDAAIAAGQATPLDQVITFIMSYQATWWLSTQARWLPVPQHLSTILDRESERIRGQDAIIASHATIRGLITLARDATAALGDQPRQDTP
jgi:hypothetical protein